MAITSFQRKINEGETVPERPVMCGDIQDAAMKGNRDLLKERLGLQTKDEQREIRVDIEDSPYAPENQNVRPELQSATRSGDTVLHLLVTKMHNELALMVFERDPSLLKVQNKILETPLHCAAKVGNEEVIHMLIENKRSDVKDALQERNEKGDTALHVAVRSNFAVICCKLMLLDTEIAFQYNKENFNPFDIAIDEKQDFVAKEMLRVDPNLAGNQLTDGTYPVHLAARKNNKCMVLYFMEHFPGDAEKVDSSGRNLFHFVAEEADDDYFFSVLSSVQEGMITRMNNATDSEGNTPLHIAAMKGHRLTMRSIWNYMTNCNAETTVKNKQGLTPYEVSKKQLEENSNKDSRWIYSLRIRTHEKNNGEIFSEEWFMDVMVPPPPPLENKWERTQVIGLGSVLITTVTFAAAFTIPGGYNQDHGTPVLGRRYIFWAFILANTLAFIQGFISLFALLIDALPGHEPLDTLEFSATFFLLAASSMVMTFGLGLYVTLALACLPIAIIVLVITLLIGSPILYFALGKKKNIETITYLVYKENSIWPIYVLSVMFIFCLALLSFL